MRVVVESGSVITLAQSMLTEYIQHALRHANYELMEDGRFFGRIPECQGFWAEATTLEDCREELQSMLEDWLLLGFQLGHPLPVIDGIDLNRKEPAQPKPIKRSELIRRLRPLGWDGPYQKGKHAFIIKTSLRLTIPNPHRGDIHWSLTSRILKEANISPEEWEAL